MTRHFPRTVLIARFLVLSLCLPGLGGKSTPQSFPPVQSDLQIVIPPSYKSEKPDSYVCTSVELKGPAVQLLGVEPHGNQDVVHHILVYGCSNPIGSPGTAWDCLHHAICKDGSSILYGWGRNAPPLAYPEGVGMAIGAGSGVKNIVVQVHYLNPRPSGDRSGVTLKTTSAPSNLAGGILSFATWFSIPPRKASHLIENKFCYQGHQPLTAFAARVHTHALGRSVSLHRQAWDHKGWQLIFDNNPQLPQAFYPMMQHQIFPGNRLKVTCDFNSTSRNTPTHAGSTHKNEMCNLYAMVYGLHPYVANIDNDRMLASPSGSMPEKGSFQPDPSPFWKPPQPGDTAPPATARSTIQQATGNADALHVSTDKNLAPDKSVSAEVLRVSGVESAREGTGASGKKVSKMPQVSKMEPAKEGPRAAGAATTLTPSSLPHIGAVEEGQARSLSAGEGRGGNVGDITGVTVAGDGSIWALYRGEKHWTAGSFKPDNTMSDSTRIQQNTVMQLHPDTGQILAAWGAGRFSMPHMITVDKEGAVYIADVGRHQVLKFSPSGVLLLALGQEMKPGTSKIHLCKPTQVAVALDGTIFVSDGYCNSRLMKFGADGQYLGEAEVPRMASGATAVVHSVLLDECTDTVLVAAREAGKVHAFHASSLKFKQTYDLPMRVWALHMGPYGKALALVWELQKDAKIVELVSPKSGQGRASWVVPGLQQRFPHDVALTAAPTVLTGAAERLFALLVAPVCGPPGCGPLLKYVLMPVGYQLPKNLYAAFEGGEIASTVSPVMPADQEFEGEEIAATVPPVMPAGWGQMRWGRPGVILSVAAVLGVALTLAARQTLWKDVQNDRLGSTTAQIN